MTYDQEQGSGNFIPNRSWSTRMRADIQGINALEGLVDAPGTGPEILLFPIKPDIYR
jgi:hypothetical protein